jgi:hypothetical protein
VEVCTWVWRFVPGYVVGTYLGKCLHF